MYQPLGVVGIIAPWNYPVQLVLMPLTGALAAGNRVMVKPAEHTPRTAELLRKMLAEVFDEDEVAVVTGGPEIGARFSRLPFDHLLFTGSEAVGRQVLRAAAENLVPVTLELGGKSPAVLCRDYPIAKAARQIAMGKFFNAGQTCIAPDYALVPADRLEAFVAAIADEIAAMYPTLADNADYTSIIDDRHYQRIAAGLEEAKEKGARLVEINPAGEATADGRKIPPTLVLDATDEMALMREEIFGPVLPVKSYADLDDAIAHINAGPRPLALYCFSRDSAEIDRILDRTVAGGVTINAALLHYAQEELPMGGVGSSGFGAYHGWYGFERFSHAKAVFRAGRFHPSEMLRPPYGRLFDTVIKFLIGR